MLALGFAGGAVYHIVGLVSPQLTEPSPPWRHALFVAIGLAVAAGLLFRPRVFVWLFAALAVQQVYGHATRGWSIWTLEHRVDWASILVLVGMPATLGLLVRDSLRRRGGGGAAQ